MPEDIAIKYTFVWCTHKWVISVAMKNADGQTDSFLALCRRYRMAITVIDIIYIWTCK